MIEFNSIRNVSCFSRAAVSGFVDYRVTDESASQIYEFAHKLENWHIKAAAATSGSESAECRGRALASIKGLEGAMNLQSQIHCALQLAGELVVGFNLVAASYTHHDGRVPRGHCADPGERICQIRSGYSERRARLTRAEKLLQSAEADLTKLCESVERQLDLVRFEQARIQHEESRQIAVQVRRLIGKYSITKAELERRTVLEPSAAGPAEPRADHAVELCLVALNRSGR